MSSNTDTGDTSSNIVVETKPNIREELISTAVSFLANPKVIRSPLNQKQSFLRSKGLTEDEIQVACERAGVFTADPNQTIINIESQSKTTQNSVVQPSQTTLGRIKDYLSTAALISGLAYAIYLLYKNYIEPFLFGRKKKKSIDEYLDEINQNVNTKNDKITSELNEIRTEMKNNDPLKLERELNMFKNDLDAIKGLLLNRKQFSSPLSSNAIPSWQLSSQPMLDKASQQERKESENSEIDSKHDEQHETDSGSGSSETEVVKIDMSKW